MSPTCWQDETEARTNRCNRVEDELDELKYWVQDVTERLEHFTENLNLYGDLLLRAKIVEFLKETEEEMRKKTNEIMGYK